MAHWAKIDENGIVESVIVTSNNDADEGESWIAENLDGTWVKTSYNTIKGKHIFGEEPLRKNFAQPGFSYDSEIDAFIPPKTDAEADFVFDDKMAIWVPPIPAPADADVIVKYGPEVDVLPEDANIYFWITEKSAWGLAPKGQAPEEDFRWDPIERQWVEAPPAPEDPS